MRAERLSDAVLVVTGENFDEHMTVIATADGLVVVDTLATLPATRAALPLVHDFARDPVRLLINTHADVDHVAGNSLFAGAVIVGHANCTKRWTVGDPDIANFLRGFIAALEGETPPAQPALAARRRTYLAAYRSFLPGFDEFRPTPPNVLIPGGFDVVLGGVRFVVDHIGPGHSDADLVVRVPQQDLVISGDLVLGTGFTPVVNPACGGSLRGTLRALDHLEALATTRTRIVPGHGEVGDRALLAPQRQYLDALFEAVAKAQASGMLLEEAKRSLHLEAFFEHCFYDLVHPGHVELAWKEAPALA